MSSFGLGAPNIQSLAFFFGGLGPFSTTFVVMNSTVFDPEEPSMLSQLVSKLEIPAGARTEKINGGGMNEGMCGKFQCH